MIVGFAPLWKWPSVNLTRSEEWKLGTISVCGTFVRTNGTAPHAYRFSTITQSFSAYFPTPET